MPDHARPHLATQIDAQPRELERLLAEPLDDRAVARLRPAERIWLVGTGTSQHAAELGALFLQAAGRDALAVGSMAFSRWTPPLRGGDAVIIISHNAGTETAYAGASWTLATERGLAVVPITRIGGELPEAVETVAKETSHTYTVSYTTALLQLARLAHALGADGFDPGTLALLPDAVADAIASSGTEELAAPARLLVLAGAGPAAVTAREGALKVREASRFAAEGYDAELLLHGHAVPLNADDHLVLLTPPDPDGLLDAIAGAAAAESVPVTRVNEPSSLPPLLAQIPLVVRTQVVALRFALERGFDPDVAIERAWAAEDLWAIGSPPSRPAGAG
jgi:glucosamine--fructose-6-phosphate aminotransferase (isomerizing)